MGGGLQFNLRHVRDGIFAAARHLAHLFQDQCVVARGRGIDRMHEYKRTDNCQNWFQRL